MLKMVRAPHLHPKIVAMDWCGSLLKLNQCREWCVRLSAVSVAGCHVYFEGSADTSVGGLLKEGSSSDLIVSMLVPTVAVWRFSTWCSLKPADWSRPRIVWNYWKRATHFKRILIYYFVREDFHTICLLKQLFMEHATLLPAISLLSFRAEKSYDVVEKSADATTKTRRRSRGIPRTMCGTSGYQATDL